MLEGFKYIANDNSTILILGTFPGEESRKTQQYYGNKRNQFWKILYEIFEEQYDNELSYDEKVEFLLRNNIAVWDVIYKCLTDGSLDSRIKHPIFNNIQKFIDDHPKITKIFSNGRMVFNYLEKQNIAKEIKILPSSSPTNTMKYVQKLTLWKENILN